MAATFRFRLGALDLSPYVRVNPDDKMDPQGAAWIEPAFVETPFSDGQPLISTTVHNREQLWPIYAKAAPGPAITNLVANPGFEWDVAGAAPAAWGPNSGTAASTFAVQTGWAASGSKATRFTVTLAASALSYYSTPAANTAGAIPVLAGTTYAYSLALNVLALGAGYSADMYINFYTGAGALVASTPVGGSAALGQRLISGTIVAPATAAFALLAPGFESGTSGLCDMYFDNVFFGAAAAVPAYADGDSPGWLWNGTPGNSTSTSLSGKDGLHRLLAAIQNAANQRPLMVEWRDDSASASTFYDVVFARFEPDFNFRRSVHNYAAGILHVWTSGYGHTGTTRVTATAAGTGIFLSVPIGSVAGDAPALLDTTISAGAVLPSLGRIVALAPIAQPSYTPRIPAASLTDLQAGASIVGASGADGSQYLALPVAPTGGASGVACMVPLPNPTIAGGDNRILAVVKSGIDIGIGMYALDPFGNSMGATAVASMSQGWGLVDLGVCRLPTVGYPTVPKISVYAGALWASGAAGGVILSSPAGLALNEVFCLPDKNLALVLESAGPAAAVALSKDGFTGNSVPLSGQNDSLGKPWSFAYNHAHYASAVGTFAATGGTLFENVGGFGPLTNYEAVQSGTIAILDADHIAGVLSDSMNISGKVTFGSPGVGMEEIRLFKDVRASQFVQARLAASGFLALESATGGVAGNLLASVAIATLAAAQKYRIALQVQGPGAFANLSRDDGGPVFAPGSMAQASVGVASNAGLAGAGAPALAMAIPSAGPAPSNAVMTFSSWEVDTLTPGPGLLAYDSYRFDGPNADTYRTSSAGVFGGQKLVAVQRGAYPKLQPSTTSVAIVCAPNDQGAANDLISAVVSIRERFSYSR